MAEDQGRRVRHAGFRTNGLEAGPTELIVRRDFPGVLEQDEQDLDNPAPSEKLLFDGPWR